MRKFVRTLAVVMAIAMVAMFAAGCGKMSLDDFVKSDTVQNFVDTSNETEDDYKVAVKADGDQLIYEYTLTEAIEDEYVQQAADMLESSIKSNESTFLSIVDQMKESVDVKDPSIAIRYLNADGSVIYETVIKR